MKKTFLLLFSAVLMLTALGAKAELPDYYRVVLLTENFPPFNMATDGKNFARDENVEGMNTDIIREMFKRAKIQYNLSLRFPWDRIYKLTLEKPNYAIFSTTRSTARDPLFKWVGPLSSTERVLVAAPGKTFNIKTLEEAKQYKIGAYKASSTGQFLENNSIPFESSLRDQINAGKLIDDKIDLWATNDPVFRYFAAQEGVTGLHVVFVAETGTSQYLAFNLETPDEVIQRLQTSLDAMRQDGTIERLRSPYLGTSN